MSEQEHRRQAREDEPAYEDEYQEEEPRERKAKLGRKPDYTAYTVQDTRDGSGFWNRIGAAWDHKDDQGMDVHLDSLPINGRVTLRIQAEKKMREYAEERAVHEEVNPPRGRGYGR